VLTLKTSKSHSNRGHKYKLRKQHVKTRFGVNRFTNRIVNNWNSLSSDTAESDSINTFKSLLNDYWKNKDSKFTNINIHHAIAN